MTKKLVWLDAGHGGSDPGAHYQNLYEKDITLKIAKRVGEIILNNYKDLIIKYTRITDIFVSLSDRAAMANKAGAEIFMSFHINAGKGTGYEDYIFFKNPKGPTKELQENVHKYVSKVLVKYGLKNRGKKTANYAVLRLTKMKAILVETAFIDTELDAVLLQKEDFIEDMCQAYANAIGESLCLKKEEIF